MGLKEEFDLAIRDSITCEYKEHLNKYRSDNKYYDEDYAILIRKYFKNKGFESYELRHNSRYKCTPICAFASSGRLCYLHFAKKEEISFEVELKNDLPNNNHPTKMDAVKGDTNYECKCQEIRG